MSSLVSNLPSDWAIAIAPYCDTEQLNRLFLSADKEYATQSVLPKESHVFNALTQTPYANVKVVILGQDPYPTKGHAMGLAFSVPNGVKIARSLNNIYKERLSDMGIPLSTSGNLARWTKQGVLLLNTVLTVREGKSDSHAHLGWQNLTIPMIKSLNDADHPIVYLLWGNTAQAVKPLINTDKHFIIETSHPSPLGATKTDKPFIGSRCFSRTNDYLKQTHQEPIDWRNL